MEVVIKNKPQLNSLFSKIWRSDESAAKVSKKRNIIVIENGNNFKITDIPEIKATIEETDARIGLYAIYVKYDGFNVEINSPNLDDFFIHSSYSKIFLDGAEILFDTGTENRGQLINVAKLGESLSESHCIGLLSLDAFTHYDTTSWFKGIEKVNPLNLLKMGEGYEYVKAFSLLK